MLWSSSEHGVTCPGRPIPPNRDPGAGANQPPRRQFARITINNMPDLGPLSGWPVWGRFTPPVVICPKCRALVQDTDAFAHTLELHNR